MKYYKIRFLQKKTKTNRALNLLYLVSALSFFQKGKDNKLLRYQNQVNHTTTGRKDNKLLPFQQPSPVTASNSFDDSKVYIFGY
jgi:hypothetical protein